MSVLEDATVCYGLSRNLEKISLRKGMHAPRTSQHLVRLNLIWMKITSGRSLSLHES